MARKSKLNSLEVQLASSILYYDSEEIENFLSLYDSITEDNNIILDGIFNIFINIYILKVAFSVDIIFLIL